MVHGERVSICGSVPSTLSAFAENSRHTAVRQPHCRHNLNRGGETAPEPISKYTQLRAFLDVAAGTERAVDSVATDPRRRRRRGRPFRCSGITAGRTRRHRLRTAAKYAGGWRGRHHLVQRRDGSGAAGCRYGRGRSAAVHRAGRDIDRSTAHHFGPDRDRGPAGRTRSDGPASSPA